MKKMLAVYLMLLLSNAALAEGVTAPVRLSTAGGTLDGAGFLRAASLALYREGCEVLAAEGDRVIGRCVGKVLLGWDVPEDKTAQWDAARRVYLYQIEIERSAEYVTIRYAKGLGSDSDRRLIALRLGMAEVIFSGGIH